MGADILDQEDVPDTVGQFAVVEAAGRDVWSGLAAFVKQAQGVLEEIDQGGALCFCDVDFIDRRHFPGSHKIETVFPEKYVVLSRAGAEIGETELAFEVVVVVAF